MTLLPTERVTHTASCLVPVSFGLFLLIEPRSDLILGHKISVLLPKKIIVQGLDDRHTGSWISYHIQVITSASSRLAFFSYKQPKDDIDI